MEDRSASEEGKRKVKVLNIIMLGTDEHHEVIRNILTVYYDTIPTGLDSYKFLLDGVGGAPHDNLASDNPMLATYTIKSINNNDGVITTQKELRPEFVPKIKTDTKGKERKGRRSTLIVHARAKVTSFKGTLQATGYEDAINEALQVIEAVIADDAELQNRTKTLVINMSGFSRGADTMLRLSNAVSTHYSNISIENNIFAIDPVPGLGRELHDKAANVPSIVKRYYIVSMEDERRPGFNPQDATQLFLENPEETIIDQRIFRGVHGHAKRFRADPKPIGVREKGMKKSADEITSDPARLLWHDLHVFARRTGTDLQGRAIPYVWRAESDSKKAIKDEQGYIDHIVYQRVQERRDEDRLTYYTNMKLHAKSYDEIAKRGVRRTFADHREYYFLHGANFFADKEHALLFKAVYPAFFDYFFEKNMHKASAEMVFADIKKMKENHPDIIKLLKDAKIVDVNTLRQLPEPKGIYLIAEYFYLHKDLLNLSAQHPAIFDYFLQANKDGASEEAVLREIAVIKRDPDLIGLLVRAGISEAKEVHFGTSPLPPSRGNENIIAELNEHKELMRLWRGIQAVCFAALSGRDHSMSKSADQETVYDMLHQAAIFLQTKNSNADKQQMLNVLIQHVVTQTQPPRLFHYKLNAIASKPIDLLLVNSTLSLLEQCDRKKLDSQRNNLLDKTLVELHALRSTHKGNDTAIISAILQSALQTSGLMLRGEKAEKETYFDKLLRQALLDVPNYSYHPRVESPKQARHTWSGVASGGMFGQHNHTGKQDDSKQEEKQNQKRGTTP